MPPSQPNSTLSDAALTDAALPDTAQRGSSPPISYRIVRSPKRQTVAIHIRSGEVTVRAPHQVSESLINQFVSERRAWITKTLSKDSVKPIVTFEGGVLVQVKGIPVRVVFAIGSSGPIKLGRDTLIIPISNRVKYRSQYALKLFDAWLEEQARPALTELASNMANALGVGSRLHGVTFKVTRSKWGHCTQAGIVQLHPRIMMAPLVAQRYLVAHEVSHLRHMNHSKEFWDTVSTLDPHYKSHRQWLKNHQNETLLLQPAVSD